MGDNINFFFTKRLSNKVNELNDKKAEIAHLIDNNNQLTDVKTKSLTKGQQVLVCGRLEINQYEDEQGEKLYITQIIAEELDFADSKKDKDENTINYESLYANGNLGYNQDIEEKIEDKNDDFPF